jgi:hypothetical protein
VATRNVALGEPLLVCARPIVALLGEQGRPPSNEELAEALLGAQLDPDQAAWLHLLHRGVPDAAEEAAAAQEEAGSGDGADSTQAAGGTAPAAAAGSEEGSETGPVEAAAATTEAAAEAPDMDAAVAADVAEAAALLAGTWQPGAADATAGGSSDIGPGGVGGLAPAAAATGNGAPPPLPALVGVPCPLDAAGAAAVVAQTAYAEESEDACAAALKELTPESVAGVWPEFALLNHSCAPNTCVAAFGTALVVSGAAPAGGGRLGTLRAGACVAHVG